METYEDRKAKLAAEMRAAGGSGVRLGKDTSNLFRSRTDDDAKRLDVRSFNHVLEVNTEQGFVDVEGMTTYADLVDAMLPHGVMPCVVPQLKSITIGGAIAGLGIESSSFRYGLAHETMQELDVLLPDGRSVLCTPDNEHSDLFYGFPNSYGTLGYALRVKARVVSVKPYVQIRHERHTDAARYFEALAAWCESDVDFVDGVVFSEDELYITSGRFTDTAPYTSDYTYMNIYYRSIQQRDEDYLTTHDYIWRWDTDWFWCSKLFFAQNPIVRRLLGRRRLNSITYTKWMRLNERLGFTRSLNRLIRRPTETVIQDVEIPIQHAQEFLSFFWHEISISPLWICPFKTLNADKQFPLFALTPSIFYVNFGFWDTVPTKQEKSQHILNSLVENTVLTLNGRKSLYSSVHFTPQQFERLYETPHYAKLKAKYDPQAMLPTLYQKCYPDCSLE